MPNKDNNTCEAQSFKFLTPTLIILIVLAFIAIVLLIISKLVSICRKRKDKTLEQAYAYLSTIECLDRVFLLANLWASTKVFSFAVCFMDLVSTAVLGIFFYNLFLQPILVHSPHFKTLYKQ